MDDYVAEIYAHGLKPATIEVRRIFATQFLNSVYTQGIRTINQISAIHVGSAALSSSSVEGVPRKLPHFLKYLKKEGLTNLDLYKAIPAFIPKRKLPSVYDKNELLEILFSINRNCLSGKRDYAIMLMLPLMGYGQRILSNLKLKTLIFNTVVYPLSSQRQDVCIRWSYYQHYRMHLRHIYQK